VGFWAEGKRSYGMENRIDVTGKVLQNAADLFCMKIVSQLSIGIPNTIGSMAHMTDMLRAADVNIDALFCTEGVPTTTVHLVTDDPETAKMVLAKIGPVTTMDVISLDMPNKPGSIAHVARKCAGAGVNIKHMYATSTGKGATLYLATEQVQPAMNALK
jgi:hypothetical protein